MSSAHWALQEAVHGRLISDTAVVTSLGEPRVWDHVPNGAAFPYVTLGVTSERDWSTSTEGGSEHVLTLHVWSRKAGRREADEIGEAIRDALHDAALTLAGHLLVNLRHEFWEVRRDADAALYHGVARYRAVTEPSA